MFSFLQVVKVIYAKSRSKQAKDFGTASKDQQVFIRLERVISPCPKSTTDTFSSYFNSNFKEFSTTENQFDLPLIINLKLVPTKLKTLHSTSNVKCSVADLIVNAHNSLSAFSAKQKRNNNRIFVLRKNLFLCLSVAKSERHYCPFFI